MDFNIQKYIDRLKDKLPEQKDKQVCINALSQYGLDIDLKYIDIKRGVLYLNNIPQPYRVKIKKHKQDLLGDINNQGVYLRDII